MHCYLEISDKTLRKQSVEFKELLYLPEGAPSGTGCSAQERNFD